MNLGKVKPGSPSLTVVSRPAGALVTFKGRLRVAFVFCSGTKSFYAVKRPSFRFLKAEAIAA